MNLWRFVPLGRSPSDGEVFVQVPLRAMLHLAVFLVVTTMLCLLLCLNNSNFRGVKQGLLVSAWCVVVTPIRWRFGGASAFKVLG
jgi:hypothetical protein